MIPDELEALVLADSVGALDPDERVELQARLNSLTPEQRSEVARLYDATDIRFEEEPIPTVGPGEALIKTKVCGICSGDVMGWYMKKKAPVVFGHEPAGEVVENLGPTRCPAR